jgi:hypothetical protein
MASSRAARAILTGGLVGGAFDIIYAFITWGLQGASPVRILQSVAAGLIGRDAAVAGGVPTGLLGLFLHFGIAIGMAAVYYALATRIPFLVRRAILSGAVYGLGLYLFMNFVVMPLSAIGQFGGGGGSMTVLVTSILVHMFLVGVPIAHYTRRALRRG